jgi:alpha/beta superfamily hydrolase
VDQEAGSGGCGEEEVNGPVELTGEAGTLEGVYSQGADPKGPVALVLHPHPQAGGSMDNPVVERLCDLFAARGASTLRFNFRGVGRSEGTFDRGVGELSDAARAMAWLQAARPEASTFWVAGYSFGSWIAARLVVERPEIAGFVLVSPPANHFDYAFLARSRTPGLVLQGGQDAIAPAADVERLVAALKDQGGAGLNYERVDGADHFWFADLAELDRRVGSYLDGRWA